MKSLVLIAVSYFRKREAVRRQRIESEQKRRDELRDGYTKLREALPAVSQKCSKVLLLDRGMSFSLVSHLADRY